MLNRLIEKTTLYNTTWQSYIYVRPQCQGNSIICHLMVPGWGLSWGPGWHDSAGPWWWPPLSSLLDCPRVLLPADRYSSPGHATTMDHLRSPVEPNHNICKRNTNQSIFQTCHPHHHLCFVINYSINKNLVLKVQPHLVPIWRTCSLVTSTTSSRSCISLWTSLAGRVKGPREGGIGNSIVHASPMSFQMQEHSGFMLAALLHQEYMETPKGIKLSKENINDDK